MAIVFLSVKSSLGEEILFFYSWHMVQNDFFVTNLCFEVIIPDYMKTWWLQGFPEIT